MIKGESFAIEVLAKKLYQRTMDYNNYIAQVGSQQLCEALSTNGSSTAIPPLSVDSKTIPQVKITNLFEGNQHNNLIPPPVIGDHHYDFAFNYDPDIFTNLNQYGNTLPPISGIVDDVGLDLTGFPSQSLGFEQPVNVSYTHETFQTANSSLEESSSKSNLEYPTALPTAPPSPELYVEARIFEWPYDETTYKSDNRIRIPWKVLDAEKTSRAVRATVRKEFDMQDKFFDGLLDKDKFRIVSEKRKRSHSSAQEHVWQPRSVFKSFTNISLNLDSTDYHNYIPMESCFGKVNMRVLNAWPRSTKKEKTQPIKKEKVLSTKIEKPRSNKRGKKSW